ncbi:MAG: amidohydrolase [Coriobacteriia bacterium]|nr:amidohydrolase [Coriobacteriia bacterium]
MSIIDVHVHVWPDKIAGSAVPSIEAAGQLRARYNGTLAGLIAEMDRTGVDISVVQPVATKPGQVCSINTWAAEIDNPRLVMFGAMHPDFEDPSAEIARIATLGLKGIKLHPEHQSFTPDEPRLDPIYRAATEHDLVVFFHAGADEIHPGIHGTPEAFATMLDRHPNMRVVLAHMGGYRVWDGVSHVLAGRNVWIDTAYTPGYLPDDDFVALIRKHGAEKVLFGSDGPWTDPAAEIAHLRRLPLAPEEIEGILGGNAARLLRL